MSKVSDAKARQGYAKSGRDCKSCYALLEKTNPESGKKTYRCGIGMFAVTRHAVCDEWEKREDPASLLARIAGGAND